MQFLLRRNNLRQSSNRAECHADDGSVCLCENIIGGDCRTSAAPNERHEELQIIAAEKNTQTAQNFDKGEYNGEE